jgi:hypothetical protein
VVDKSAISGGGFLLQLLLVRSYPVHLVYFFLLGDALHRFIICIDLQPSVSMALEGVRTELEVLYFLCCLIEFKQRVSRLLLLVSSHLNFFCFLSIFCDVDLLVLVETKSLELSGRDCSETSSLGVSALNKKRCNLHQAPYSCCCIRAFSSSYCTRKGPRSI